MENAGLVSCFRDEVDGRLSRASLTDEGRELHDAVQTVWSAVEGGNRWVPYPLSFPTWRRLASRCGFRHTGLLATVPSRFLGQIYAALSYKGEEVASP